MSQGGGLSYNARKRLRLGAVIQRRIDLGLPLEIEAISHEAHVGSDLVRKYLAEIGVKPHRRPAGPGPNAFEVLSETELARRCAQIRAERDLTRPCCRTPMPETIREPRVHRILWSKKRR